MPAAQSLGPVMVRLAKIGFTVMLFFSGAGLSARTACSVGVRPNVLGLLL